MAAALLLFAWSAPRAAQVKPKPLVPEPAPRLVEVLPGEYRIEGLPVSIVHPGLYRLGGTLTAGEVPSPTTDVEAFGIIVRSSHVTIDLGGHELVGGKNTLTGIVATTHLDAPPLIDISIRNGTLRQWGAWGIDTSIVTGARLDGVSVIRNGAGTTPGGGMLIGPHALLDGCRALENTGVGIWVASGALLTRCLASFNVGMGIVLGDMARASLCNASMNTTTGILAGRGASLRECSASINEGAGFVAGAASTLRDCDAWGNSVGISSTSGDAFLVGNRASDNDGSGIFIRGESSRLDGNHLSGNAVGVQVIGHGHLIVRNTFQGNATAMEITPGNTTGGVYEAPSPYLRPEQKDPAADPLDGLRPWVNIVQ